MFLTCNDPSQSHGHANESLTLAAAEAAGRYGHVLFPSGTHEPALNLAEKLLATVGQGWASRVFYSDNGSTGIEVALKMALRAAGRRYGWDGEVGGDVGIIGLRGGYHGDTVRQANSVLNIADAGRSDRWMQPRLRLSTRQLTGTFCI
jgi:dethiobiotin synthetase/adenosylmethionine--8-amino-7-oxononanoate aminotransferase